MSKSSQHLPQKLHQAGVYYGWIILAAGTIGVIMSIPGQTMGISVYTEFLIKSLDIDRLSLSFSYMAGTLCSAFLLPFAGRFLDRRGSRIMGLTACLSLAFFLVFMAFSPQLTDYLSSVSGIPHKWAGLSVTFVAFLGVRHFGQGQLTMASRTMMGRWFQKRRGFILGISGMFVAFGFGLAPLLLTKLISVFEWQQSLYVLGILSVLMAAFAWMTYRHSPEECGLEVDGGLKNPLSQEPSSEESEFTSHEAVRTGAFWAFNLGMVAQALLLTAITFHMARIGQLQGMTSARAFSVYLPIAVVSILADLIGGYLSDRISIRYLLTVMQSGMCIGLLGLQSIETQTGFAFTALGFGISNGLFSLLMGAAWPKLFGRKHLGAIAGYNMAWVVGGSAVGPYLFSLGETSMGTFREVIFLSLILPVSIAAVSLFIKLPVKPARLQS